jgi:hypothetical protein
MAKRKAKTPPRYASSGRFKPAGAKKNGKKNGRKRGGNGATGAAAAVGGFGRVAARGVPKKAIGRIPGGFKLSVKGHQRSYRPSKQAKRTKAGRFKAKR